VVVAKTVLRFGGWHRGAYEVPNPCPNACGVPNSVRTSICRQNRVFGAPHLAAVLAQWPDIRFERKRVHIGAGHFVSEYEMSATSDGQVITCDGVDVIAVEGGRVARKDTYLDWSAIQQQLGEPISAISA
jgi:hypothetical protein